MHLLEHTPDVQQIDLAPGHHDPGEGSLIGADALATWGESTISKMGRAGARWGPLPPFL